MLWAVLKLKFPLIVDGALCVHGRSSNTSQHTFLVHDRFPCPTTLLGHQGRAEAPDLGERVQATHRPTVKD